MAGAVEAVGGRPGSYGFFAVGPDQPDAVAIALLAGCFVQLVGVFEQDGGGRAAVVGAYEAGVAQGINGVVVAEDGDDAVFGTGKFGDDVADGKLPFYGVGGESDVFYLVAFQMIDYVVLQFFVILVAHVTGAEGGDFFGVLEGALGIDVRERGVVGGGRFRWGWCRLRCSLRLKRGFGLRIGSTGTGSQGERSQQAQKKRQPQRTRRVTKEQLAKSLREP